MPRIPEKIAVFRYRFIGDTVLTTPFLRELRTRHPQAEIHFLVGADAYPLVEHCPYIDRAIVFEPRKTGFWGSIRALKEQSYQTGYFLKRSFSSALMGVLAGIPKRIGFNTEGRGFLLTEKIPYKGGQQHEAQSFLDVLGVPSHQADLRLEAWIPDDIQTKMHALANTWPAGPRIVLHAASTNPAKCWPLPHFQKLAETFAREYRAQLIFLGSPQEKVIYEDLIAALPQDLQKQCHLLAGQTSILESQALLKEVDLVIGNDSGLIHLAASVDTPVIALFGPSNPVQWKPLGSQVQVLNLFDLNCVPCEMKISCQHQYPCLSDLPPERVLAACKPLLTSLAGLKS